MRIAAVIVFAAALVLPAAAKDAPEGVRLAQNGAGNEAVQPATVEALFNQFHLFGAWAANCARPAAPDNPHVRIIMPSPGLVLEEHSLGADYAVNRYSVLKAERLSATRLAVQVIFQPGKEDEERQRLVFLVRDNTRRTLFNQVEGGPVRVKDGIALSHRTRTPALRKCE